MSHDGVHVLMFNTRNDGLLTAINLHINVTLSGFFKLFILATAALGFKVLAAIVRFLGGRINISSSHLGILDHGIWIRDTRAFSFSELLFLFLGFFSTVFISVSY
jgi:hypothetical protein